MASSPRFVSPYYSPEFHYTTVHELGSDPSPSRSPSPAIEDEIALLQPEYVTSSDLIIPRTLSVADVN